MKGCACHKQIVWFFDKPTVVVCKKCEKTFYHDVTHCNECGKPVTYFVEEGEC